MPDTTYPTPAELEAKAQAHERIGLTRDAAGMRIPISEFVNVMLPGGDIVSMSVEKAVETIADYADAGQSGILCDVNPYQAHDIHHDVCDLRRARAEAPDA